MKRFTEYLNEDFDPAIYNSDGAISIKDPTVLDAINSNLEVSTSCVFRTPYNALEEVRKVLAYYKIFLPKGIFLDQNHGNDVFEVSQFGEKMGMNNDGEVVTASDSSLFVYFEWSLGENGMYDIFAALVDQEELDEILADFDAETQDDETDLQEEMTSIGKVSKMLYKAVNQSKAAKQKSDVEEYIEHEKQGKTFTQQCDEEAMPDLKKKMGAKKVTLPNMMRKEENINEVSRKAATSAYAAADDPDYYHPKADKILGHIKRKFGSKAASDAETHAYADHFGRGTPSPGKDSLSGGLRQYLDDKLTKSGKIPKGTQKAMKNRMDPKKWQGYGRKVGGPKKQLPEETINEVSKEKLKKLASEETDRQYMMRMLPGGPAPRRKSKHPFHDIPAPESKTPDPESNSRIKKLTKRLAKKGMSEKK